MMGTNDTDRIYELPPTGANEYSPDSRGVVRSDCIHAVCTANNPTNRVDTNGTWHCPSRSYSIAPLTRSVRRRNCHRASVLIRCRDRCVTESHHGSIVPTLTTRLGQSSNTRKSYFFFRTSITYFTRSLNCLRVFNARTRFTGINDTVASITWSMSSCLMTIGAG